MEQQQNTYRSLQELSNSDFQIVDGEPNIIGWKVKSENGSYLGKIDELLFDPEARSVRYLIIDLEENELNNRKKVMIPIGLAHLHTSDDEVIFQNFLIDQFNALPTYQRGEVGPETELQIRSVFGNPDTDSQQSINNFDQNHFYTHESFNKDRFYQRDRADEN